MPRRDYEDDDDDFDDRPRPRTRRRYEDDKDDDYDPRPRRRQGSSGSNAAVIIIALVIGGVVLLALFGVGAYVALRAKPLAGPVAVNNPPPPVFIPPPIAQPARPMMPGMPVVPGPGAAAIGNPVTISNLRVQGVGLRTVLVFDYRFQNGRPIGLFTAISKEPNGQTTTFNLHNLDQQGTLELNSIGPPRGNYPSGTQVYIANHAVGPRNVPPPISNTLTLP